MLKDLQLKVCIFSCFASNALVRKFKYPEKMFKYPERMSKYPERMFVQVPREDVQVPREYVRARIVSVQRM